MLKSLTTKKILVFCILALPTIGAGQQRAAVGPIENIQIEKARLTVLGQTFAISDATKFAVNGQAIAKARGSEALAVGQNVYVEGVDLADRSLATLVAISSDEYVPGSTSVYVFGNVSEVSGTRGTFRIGSLLIDSSAVNPDLLSKIQVGTSVEISGIQPSTGGRLVGLDQLSIGGTGKQKQSVGGTGTQIQSIGGTGKQKQSIGGTGVLLQSIGGTGKQKQSIGGTGAQLQSIGGTGKQKQSIGGTGAQLQSIGGTGKQKQSIGGTGAQLQSIGGTGKQKQSIGGTGTQLQSIGGTGSKLQSIGWTGSRY